jgi:hypothetical protein
LELTKFASRQGTDPSVLGVERDEHFPTKGGLGDQRQAGIRWQPQGGELPHRFDRQTAGAGFGADLRVSFQHDDLSPGLGENLGGTQASRSRADNNRLHVSNHVTAS